MKSLGILLIVLLLGSLFSCFKRFDRSGTAWAPGSFSSNGERIYFSSSSERGERITYTGGPNTGMMMTGGLLACASCHGTNARGGKHLMHMQVMDSPDIRWVKLEHEEEEEHVEDKDEKHSEEHLGYDMDDFRVAVIEGQHPDGKSLKQDMPRWNIGEEDLLDLANYLKSLL